MSGAYLRAAEAPQQSPTSIGPWRQGIHPEFGMVDDGTREMGQTGYHGRSMRQ